MLICEKQICAFLFTEESIQEWYTLKKQSCPPGVNIFKKKNKNEIGGWN